MAEYIANAQTIAPGETVVFESATPCRRGFVRHRNGSGNFLLSGWVPAFRPGCPCVNQNRSAEYLVDFGANIAIPTGGTVAPISVAIALDGTTLAESVMTVTPAAVEEFFNVSRAVNVDIWRGCCETVTVRNVSDQPILLNAGNIIFSRPDLNVTY